MLSAATIKRLDISWPLRLKVLNLALPHVNDAIDRNIRRSNEYAQLEALAEGQHVAIWIWERDCDCVEGTRRRLIRPTRAAYDRMAESLLYQAEGPISWSIHRPSEPFEPYSRDRVLEAFEDGHPWSV
jgi:hypothetical protein